jgi:hypothetical protein
MTIITIILGLDSIYEWKHAILAFFELGFPCLTWWPLQFCPFSCKQHNDPFLKVWIIVYIAYIPYFLYPFIVGHLGWFHSLPIVSSAVINMNVQASLLFVDLYSFGYRT